MLFLLLLLLLYFIKKKVSEGVTALIKIGGIGPLSLASDKVHSSEKMLNKRCHKQMEHVHYARYSTIFLASSPIILKSAYCA